MNERVRAWSGVVLVPVALVVGLVLAFLLEGTLAGDTTGDERSLPVDLLGLGLTALLVVAATAVSWRQRGPSTRTPRLVATVLAAVVVVLLVAQVLVNAGSGSY